MNPQTLEQRVKALEDKLATLLDDQGWQKLAVAAKNLGCSADTLRRRIKKAKTFPKESPYKKGIHWRKIGGIYQIHLTRWVNVSQ